MRPMLAALATFATLAGALAGTLAPLAAQQLDDAKSRVEEAREWIARGAAEDASLTLRDAYWLLRRAPRDKHRQSLRSEIDGLLRKIDPAAREQLTAQAKLVDVLEKAIESYRAAGQRKLADRLAAQLVAISPALAARTEPAAAGGDGGLLATWFRDGETPYDDETWEVGDAEVRAPTFANEAPWSAILISKLSLEGDFTVALDIDVARVVRAGLAFGVRDAAPRPKAFCLAEIDPSTRELVVSRLQGDQLVLVGSVRLAAKPDGWCPLQLEVEKGVLTATVGAEKKRLVAKLEGATDGRLGLYCTSKATAPGPARFRAFRVRRGGAGD